MLFLPSKILPSVDGICSALDLYHWNQCLDDSVFRLLLWPYFSRSEERNDMRNLTNECCSMTFLSQDIARCLQQKDGIFLSSIYVLFRSVYANTFNSTWDKEIIYWRKLKDFNAWYVSKIWTSVATDAILSCILTLIFLVCWAFD